MSKTAEPAGLGRWRGGDCWKSPMAGSPPFSGVLWMFRSRVPGRRVSGACIADLTGFRRSFLERLAAYICLPTLFAIQKHLKIPLNYVEALASGSSRRFPGRIPCKISTRSDVVEISSRYTEKFTDNLQSNAKFCKR